MTKLTLEKSALVRALGHVSRVVEKRTTIPVLANVMLVAGGGRLSITGTDLDIELTTQLEAGGVHTPASTTIHAGTLHDIARKLPDGSLTLEWEAEGQASLRAGRSRFSLQTLPPGDFPTLDHGTFTHSFTLPGDSLAGMIEAVNFAISTEETRYYLNGIYFHEQSGPDGPNLRAVATDGHRLARFDLLAPEGTSGMPGVIVPRKTVNELAKLGNENKGAVRIELSPAKIRATFEDGTVLTSKLIDGTFPDYQRVIPTRNDKVATLPREDFARAMERVSTISSERGRGVKCSFEAGTLRLSASNPDAGTAEEETAVRYDAAPLEMGFNARYLGDILNALGGDEITMALSDPGSSALLQATGNTALLAVLMPMRV